MGLGEYLERILSTDMATESGDVFARAIKLRKWVILFAGLTVLNDHGMIDPEAIARLTGEVINPDWKAISGAIWVPGALLLLQYAVLVSQVWLEYRAMVYQRIAPIETQRDRESAAERRNVITDLISLQNNQQKITLELSELIKQLPKLEKEVALARDERGVSLTFINTPHKTYSELADELSGLRERIASLRLDEEEFVSRSHAAQNRLDDLAAIEAARNDNRPKRIEKLIFRESILDVLRLSPPFLLALYALAEFLRPVG